MRKYKNITLHIYTKERIKEKREQQDCNGYNSVLAVHVLICVTILLQEEILKHVRLGGDRDARLLYAAVSEIIFNYIP